MEPIPIKEITSPQTGDIIEKIKKDVNENGSASVSYWITQHFSRSKDTPIQYHVMEKVLGKITLSGEYLYIRRPGDRYDFAIQKNPNFELNKSTIELNRSTIATNASLQILNTSSKELNTSSQELNTKTKKYYINARNSTWAIVALTLVSAGIALRSAYISSEALTQNQKQFELETTPFLQISNVHTDTLKIGQPVVINYTLLNVGKDQAKLLSGEITMVATAKCDTIPFGKYARPEPTYINAYSIKETPYQGQWRSLGVLDADVYDSITNQKYFIFFLGEIKYKNLVNGKIRKYYFNVQTFHTPVFGVQFLYNENKEDTIQTITN